MQKFDSFGTEKSKAPNHTKKHKHRHRFPNHNPRSLGFREITIVRYVWVFQSGGVVFLGLVGLLDTLKDFQGCEANKGVIKKCKARLASHLHTIGTQSFYFEIDACPTHVNKFGIEYHQRKHVTCGGNHRFVECILEFGGYTTACRAARGLFYVNCAG